MAYPEKNAKYPGEAKAKTMCRADGGPVLGQGEDPRVELLGQGEDPRALGTQALRNKSLERYNLKNEDDLKAARDRFRGLGLGNVTIKPSR